MLTFLVKTRLQSQEGWLAAFTYLLDFPSRANVDCKMQFPLNIFLPMWLVNWELLSEAAVSMNLRENLLPAFPPSTSQVLALL